MPFDPTKPATNSPLSSAEMRNQLTSLKALIDGIPAGPPGPQGPEGPQGPPGEVTFADLNGAIGGTSNNSNGVDFFNGTFSDPPTSGECQAMADKMNELIGALRR